MKKTLPKPLGISIAKTDPALLAHGRYGTDDMIKIWGPERTYQFSLDAQASAVATMSELYPEIVPPAHAKEITEKANLNVIEAARIRELEEKTGHDVMAINTSLEEKVSKEARSHIGKARTSADTVETAKALQLKNSIEVVVDSLENLRDITLEKGMEWMDKIHMDETHWYDALPTFAGRPFMFYGEMLQSNLDWFAFVYKNSLKGKWADATGSHHSATDLGIDGIKLQEEYCKKLSIGYMIAPAQIPGREFVTDIIYVMARSAETMQNLAFYIAWGFGDDVNIFKDTNPKKRKGSSAMPHKDIKGGNRTIEEQTESFANYMRGAMQTSLSSCKFRYARDLSGSASDRIILEDMFKWGDFVIRRLAEVVYYLDLNEDRCIERVRRAYGVVTSERVLTYLTDHRKTQFPMAREEAHNLVSELATKAYNEKREFGDVLLESPDVVSRLSTETIRMITNPMNYTGQSREIIEKVFNAYHGRKVLVTEII
ncbi:MAG: lyase family protein [Candidatus Aenigmarchaeota archaeon]|nr:lyase family protein [Candidatus Aenigmarchaeota archaeon]